MAAAPQPFEEATVLTDAQQAAGLEDFGDAAFRQPLRVLLASLSQAPLNPVGIRILRSSLVWSLVSRLRAQHWFEKHPEIATETIQAPIVVVGMMRSGTTLLQRLLSCDPRHTCALGWEVREPAPAPGNWQKTPDPRIAAAEAQVAQTRQFAPELFAIHPSFANEAEEEIVFLANAFLSHVPEASCDVPVYRKWLDAQDFTPAYENLKRMLQLLQWQKAQRGEERGRWILKTPAHLGYLDTLFATFPDAHVVHMHRDPLETIPSGASLNTTLWRMHAGDVDPRRVGRQWLERMTFTNNRALSTRKALPDETKRFTDILFRDAVTAPLLQVQKIYDALGIPFSDDAARAMEAWLARDGQEERPAHHYSPEEFGLRRGDIDNAFAAYTERFLSP